jgi:hypothetical protein
MSRLVILFVMTWTVLAADRPVGTALYSGRDVAPSQGQRRDDMKLYLLGIDRNGDGSPGYRLRVYTETAVYKNNASFQWAWCNWSGFIKNTVTGRPDPGPPEEAGRIDINANGAFHASIGGGLGRCSNTRMFDAPALMPAPGGAPKRGSRSPERIRKPEVSTRQASARATGTPAACNTVVLGDN